MKLKIMATLILSSTLLFSNTIVGAWTIDKDKAEKLFEAHANNEMEQFVIAMITEAMTDIEFKEDGSCKMTSKSRDKCWEFTKNSYLLYEDDGKEGGEVKIIDSNRIEIILSTEDLIFEFTRVDEATVTSTKNINEK